MLFAIFRENIPIPVPGTPSYAPLGGLPTYPPLSSGADVDYSAPAAAYPSPVVPPVSAAAAATATSGAAGSSDVLEIGKVCGFWSHLVSSGKKLVTSILVDNMDYMWKG